MPDFVFNVTVGENRKLVIELPPNAPIGDVQVVVRQAPPYPESTLTRDEARQRLLDAGFLVTSIKAPEDALLPVLEEPLVLPSGAISSEQIIDEDRGKY
jgi:hypothetical protein